MPRPRLHFSASFFADTDVFDEAEKCVKAVAEVMSVLSEERLLKRNYGTCISELEK